MAVPDPDRPSLAASVPASARRRMLIWLACAGKAVDEVEYTLAPARFCARARADGFEAMRKPLDLDAWRKPCW
jgi:hypothetical protein